MSTLPDSPVPLTAPPVFDRDRVFAALGFPIRRQLFLHLCMKGSCTVSDVAGGSSHKRDSNSKQLPINLDWYIKHEAAAATAYQNMLTE